MENNNTQARMIASEVGLIHKLKVKASECPQISSSNDAYEILMTIWDQGKIEFIAQFTFKI